jgi:hypothetical protein
MSQIFGTKIQVVNFVQIFFKLNHWKTLKMKISKVKLHSSFRVVNLKLWPKKMLGINVEVSHAHELNLRNLS